MVFANQPMTRDTQHLTCDTWHLTHVIIFFLLLHFRLFLLVSVRFGIGATLRTHWEIQYAGFLGRVWVTYLMLALYNRTVSATPGMLTSFPSLKKHLKIEVGPFLWGGRLWWCFEPVCSSTLSCMFLDLETVRPVGFGEIVKFPFERERKSVQTVKEHLVLCHLWIIPWYLTVCVATGAH